MRDCCLDAPEVAAPVAVDPAVAPSMVDRFLFLLGAGTTILELPLVVLAFDN